MKIKSTVYQWLAMACFAVGMVFACGVEGAATDEGMVSCFITSMVLILAALLFMRLSFAAEDREKAAKRRRYGKIDRSHARNPEYPQDQERGA